MSKFANKTVFISGGTTGIGKATAQEFIRQGAKVIITGRTAEKVKKAVEELGTNATGFASDAGKWSDLQLLQEKVKAITTKLDVLFVNAGSGQFAPIEEVTEEHYDAQFNVLVKGSFFTVQQLLPLLGEGTSIIFNTSVVTDMGMPGASVYSATKGAVQSLIKTFGGELVGRGIRVNAVSPGPIQTQFFANTGMSEEEIEGFANSILPNVPLKRFGSPSEIAKVVTFLASEDASYMVGTELQIDGGLVQF